MMGRLNRQSTFDDLTWRQRIPKDSYWYRLQQWAQETLREEDFAPLFASTGRPSVSPLHTLLALLIQLEQNGSDRQLEGESRFDDRVKFALLAGRNFPGLDAVTLCDHRARFLQGGVAGQLLEKTLQSAQAHGLFSKENLQVVDSFLIHGAAARQDPYTLIRKAVVRTLRIARLHEREEPLRAVLRRDDYEAPGKPKIDWDDPEARRQLLEELVHDALRLVEAARRLEPLPEDLAAMVELLERVARQDVTLGPDGRVEMVQGTAKDRILSVHDPEMRHGRKTASKKVDGYKGHILTTGRDGDLVAGVSVTPANAPDDEPLEGMLEEQGEQGRPPAKVLGDTAYYDPERNRRWAEQGTTILAKAPPVAKQPGRFSKEAFRIDLQAGTVTCPAGQEARFDPIRVQEEHRPATVHFEAAVCNACSLKAQCTETDRGRMVTLHPYEADLQRDRQFQKTEAFQEVYRQRSTGERVISHLTRHGARHARYLGQWKTTFQLLLVAANHNIQRIMRQASAYLGPPAAQGVVSV